MQFITKGKTNIGYLLIVMIIAILAGGFIYWQYSETEKIKESSNIELPKKGVQGEACFDFKGNVEGPIMEGITDESLHKIIVRYIVESVTEYSVDFSESICKLQTITVEGEQTDLNDDGVPEYIVYPEGVYLNDNLIDTVRGASGNGPIFVFGNLQGKWTLIGNLGGNSVTPLSRSNKGYLNLAAYWHMSAVSGIIDEYAWNGEVYELIKTTEENQPETLE